MSVGPTGAQREGWPAWETRVATELSALTEADWLSVTPTPGPAVPDDVSGRRSWRRAVPRPGRSRPDRRQQATVPDVFVQARVVEGLLALEMIGDTEFEGLSDLTVGQQADLVAAGWEQDGTDPTFSRTFAPGDAAAAARLLSATLHGILHVEDPASVELRRS